jgi:hypothetical protein
MNGSFRPDLVVNLGDVIEDQDAEADRRNYSEFLSILGGLTAPVLHVAGNHDGVHLSDGDLGELWGRGRDGPLFYAQSLGPFTLVVLRTVETKGRGVEIPYTQLAWLDAELGVVDRPVIVLMHHPASDMHLEGNRWFEGAPHLCRLANRKALRSVLQRSGKVAAVFNGHVHWNHLDIVAGVPYVTVQSLIENVDDDAPGRAASAWALAELKNRELSVHVVGEHPQRYQFDLSHLL